MIKSIEVTNYLGDTIELELGAPEKTGLFIKSIDGLGAGKANINTTNLASSDGGVFNSARSEIRNIVLSIGFVDRVDDNKKWSIEELRHLTYQFFPKKKFVKLTIHTDIRDLYTEGYVESNEPEIFSEMESTSISIICPDPTMYNSKGSSIVDFSSVTKNFSFPFSNDSLSDREIVFGEIEVEHNKMLEYTGELETGITIVVHPRLALAGFKLVNSDTGDTIGIDETKLPVGLGGITSYDTIEICTVSGKKYATLTRNGISRNIINALNGGENSKKPNWLQIHNGINHFYYTATSGGDDLTLLIYYNNAYEGI